MAYRKSNLQVCRIRYRMYRHKVFQCVSTMSTYRRLRIVVKVKQTVTDWSDPEGSRRLSFADFMTCEFCNVWVCVYCGFCNVWVVYVWLL